MKHIMNQREKLEVDPKYERATKTQEQVLFWPVIIVIFYSLIQMSRRAAISRPDPLIGNWIEIAIGLVMVMLCIETLIPDEETWIEVNI
ncbi:hypothetical protein [Lacticaseibacillus paracasei]|uniref:hypothetical protein n=1 Tax=Lacticaseibacillus paracasei TaxID=1597 RepID=UPI000FF208C3|nr:hypothetical protein [Lacticaseibacillus paracasei]RWZ61015.1 hypothetical protein EQK34_16025 [Lacticaseibacillus paracasei]